MDKSTFWICAAVVLIAFMYFASQSDKAVLQNEKYYNCVTAMNKAIPDPNDDGRAAFLADCNK